MEKSLNEDLIDCLYERFGLSEVDMKTYSPLTLAYIGDSIYDLMIRTLVVHKGNSQVNKLHKRTSSLVKAEAQSAMMDILGPMLTEEEMHIYKRGRNAKSFTTAKNASVKDYRRATGFEALMGWLYLEKDYGRMMDLIKAGVEGFTRK